MGLSWLEQSTLGTSRRASGLSEMQGGGYASAHAALPEPLPPATAEGMTLPQPFSSSKTGDMTMSMHHLWQRSDQLTGQPSSDNGQSPPCPWPASPAPWDWWGRPLLTLGAVGAEGSQQQQGQQETRSHGTAGSRQNGALTLAVLYPLPEPSFWFRF